MIHESEQERSGTIPPSRAPGLEGKGKEGKGVANSPSTPPSPTSTREQSDAWMDWLRQVRRDIESIPYTPPEVIGADARWLLELVDHLISAFPSVVNVLAEGYERPVSVPAARVAPVEPVVGAGPVKGARSDEEIRADLAIGVDDERYVDTACILADDVPELLAERDAVQALNRSLANESSNLLFERDEARAALAAVRNLHRREFGECQACEVMWPCATRHARRCCWCPRTTNHRRGAAMTYPSGAEMPQYGPTTEDEMITDGLEWAYAMLLARDEMNAAVHCGPVRLSDVTVKTRTALGLWRQRLADDDGADGADGDPEVALRAWLDQRGKQDSAAVAEAIADLAASLAADSPVGVPEPPQEPQPTAGRHFVTARGWCQQCGSYDWDHRAEPLPDGERITDSNGDELEHGSDSEDQR